MFWFFDPRHMGSYLSEDGVNLHPAALEGKVLTTEWPGKSLFYKVFFFKLENNCFTMLGWFLPPQQVNQS